MQKRLINCLPLLLLLLVFTGCDRDEIDVAENIDFPPSILSAYPAADGRVVAGDFDVRVVFADGSASPLSSATVTLSDSSMNEITEVTRELSGLQDSLVIMGSTFDADSLAVGIYNLSISVTDTRGQTTTDSYSFQISNLPFPANVESVYIAGAFNGWTPSNNQLTLIGPNLWEVKGVDLSGGEWKLVDGPEFGGEDWGDTDCDGFMESKFSPSGNGNTACDFPGGLVDIRFNDQTLSYTVAPQVTFASNTMSLYLLGTFNNFSGGEHQLSLIGDNSWELDEIELSPGDQFKFAEMPDFVGTNYGDDNNDGVAQIGGSNIVVADSLQEGIYSVSFNDRTLAYQLDFLRPTYTTIGIIGSAAPGGWETEADFDMIENEDGTFKTVIALVEGELKFRADDDPAYTLNWGGSEFPAGTAVVNGSNIKVPTAGIYFVQFDPEALTYSFEPASIGIIGDAVQGWETDVDLTPTGEVGEVSQDITLKEGQVKFRVNDSFDVYNWGGNDFPTGTAIYNAGNIPSTPGTYTVTFNVNTLEYSFN